MLSAASCRPSSKNRRGRNSMSLKDRQNDTSGLLFEPLQPEHLQACLDIYGYYVENSTATFHTHVPSMVEFKEIVYIGCERNKGFVILHNSRICGYVALGRTTFGSFMRHRLHCNLSPPRVLQQRIGSAALIFEHYACNRVFTRYCLNMRENEQSIRR